MSGEQEVYMGAMGMRRDGCPHRASVGYVKRCLQEQEYGVGDRQMGDCQQWMVKKVHVEISAAVGRSVYS